MTHDMMFQVINAFVAVSIAKYTYVLIDRHDIVMIFLLMSRRLLNFICIIFYMPKVYSTDFNRIIIIYFKFDFFFVYILIE